MTIPLRLATTGYPTASPAARAEPTSRVHPVVRAALYLYIASIPFEFPGRTIPLEIPTLTGLVYLAATLINPVLSYRRLPLAVVWFGLHLWVLAAVTILLSVEHFALAARQFVLLLQLLFLLWSMYNLLGHPAVLRGALITLIASCTVRAAIQVLGIGTTSYEVWTGGTRVTTLGQNMNLSAMILSAGLLTVLGLQVVKERWLPRPGRLAIPLAALLGWAILQTGSRGGVVCALVGLAAFSITGRNARQRIRNAALGVVGLAVMIWGVTRTEVLYERFGLAVREGAWAGREHIWPAAIGMIQERPFFGWGLIENQYEIGRRIAHAKGFRDAHNLVLEIFTNSGLAGAIPFIVGLALCVGAAWRARKGPLGVFPFAVLMAILVGTLSGTWIASKILWLALAIGLAAGGHYAMRVPDPPRSQV